MSVRGRIEFPSFRFATGWPTEMTPILGAPVAIVVGAIYGVPLHAVVSLVLMLFIPALGITAGFHRLFTHRSFATTRPIEWMLMILGCVAGESSPFFWVATHRRHHQHSDHDGDPHSPYVWDGHELGFWPGLWHSHFGWLRANGYGYRTDLIPDLMRRPDLAWINHYWLHWWLIGLVIPAIAGYLIGGTAYDALIGFLWGGLLRHFLLLQITFAVNSVTHLWGSQPFKTSDQSRNNLLVGLLALGEGWHNNHHAFPYSARHGFNWTQPDFTWAFIWTLEKLGLAWQIKLPSEQVLSQAKLRSAPPARRGDPVDLRAST